MTDSETLTLRVTVIGRERYANDYQVIWRGMFIGRIRRTSDVSGAPMGLELLPQAMPGR